MKGLDRALDVCLTAVHDAGRLTLGYFGGDVKADAKADDSPVTVADVRAEELIRTRLEAAFPAHGIVGEEHGVSRPEAAARWYIDPIDGTKSFMRGVPLYAVLLALEVEEEVVVGAAYFPALDELLYATKGGGAFLNGRRVRVRATSELARAFVSFTDAASFAKQGRTEGWQRVLDATYHRPGWSDAYGHALVASGRVEAMLDPVLNPHDGAPFGVILPEAGGYFGDFAGHAGIHHGEGLSTTPELLPQLVELLAR
ncbi:MAG TPA: inositol monophosphatase family protein [Trueperaceae bacterium]|nr:inositol monophosphatase family protein [Trueperaceae bacterium]